MKRLKPPKHNSNFANAFLNRQSGHRATFDYSVFQKKSCLDNIQSLSLAKQLEEHEDSVNSLNIHPNGDVLVSGGDDLLAYIWDWRSGEVIHKINTKHKVCVTQTKFLNLLGPLHLVTSGRDGTVRLHTISPDGSRVNKKMAFHEKGAHNIAVAHDHPQVFFSAGQDGRIMMYDLRTDRRYKLVTPSAEETKSIYTIDHNPLKKEICIGCMNGAVRVFDRRKQDKMLAQYFPRRVSKRDDVYVTSVSYNYNGSEILAAYNDSIYLFDPSLLSYSGKYIGSINHRIVKQCKFYGSQSEFIVSGSDCGNIFFWDKTTADIVQCLAADKDGTASCIEAHPHVPFLFTGGNDFAVKVWMPSSKNVPDEHTLQQILFCNKFVSQSLANPGWGGSLRHLVGRLEELVAA